MMNLLLLVLGLAIFVAVIWIRVDDSASEKLNQKYFARGSHQRGQDLVSQELTFAARGSLPAVKQAILSTVKVAPSVPALLHDAYLIKSTDTQILYGAGNKLHQSFRGLLTLRATENGTSGTWEIVNWTLGDGIVTNQSIMNRLIADIDTALRSVDPNAALRPKNTAASSSSGAPRYSSPPPPAPPMNNSAATNTLGRPKTSQSVEPGISQLPTTSTPLPGSPGGSDWTAPQPTRNVATISTQARPDAAYIRLQRTTQGFDILINDQSSTNSLAIFNQTRYLMLEQLKQRGMGVGHIKTNSKSERRSNFEASIWPTGEVSLTLGDEPVSSNGSPDSMQPHIRLTFSDFHTPPDTVTSMVSDISSGLQRKFEEIEFAEPST